MKLPDSCADACAPRPVRHRARDRSERLIWPARTKLSCDPCQSRRKNERLDATMTVRDRMREVQEHAGIALHRSADVAQQDEGTRTHVARPAPQRDHVALRAETVRDGAAEINSPSAPGNPSSGPAFARAPGQPGQRGGAVGYFGGREGGKVFFGQESQVTPCRN